MNVISHIAYPVLFAQSANLCRIQNHKTSFFKGKHLLLIGICGGLPDILSPHLGLEERYNSFSHSIFFLLLAAIAGAILLRIFPGHKRLIYVCWSAAAFHFLCDMIAGGINLFGPFGRMVVGKHYLPFRFWIPLDVAGILFSAVTLSISKCSGRARAVILISGCALALCGAGIVSATFDFEALLTKKLPASRIDSTQLEQARRVWDDLLTRWRVGTFERLPDRFTDKVRDRLTPQLQMMLFEQIQREYGDFQGMAFVEAIAARFYFPRMVAYRFKGAFAKTSHRPEIGIWFDHNGKVSALIFRDEWKNKIL
jgi:hypothetical protein